MVWADCPFTDRQIDLLKTFADQAVIAIENTRLFEEVQARTRELTELLEYQTATSEVLGVIGRSPSDVQPVLDAIVQTAVRLCDAEYAIVYKRDDGRYHPVATNNVEDQLVKYAYAHSLAPGRGSLVGRTALERRTVHLPDCLADPEYDHLEYQRNGKYRSTLGVPLLRQGIPIGVVVLMRAVVKPLTEKQIELVTTFADQAVIAIENTRLFEEVQARNRDLTALGEVGRAVAQLTLDLKVVLKTIVDRAVALSGTDSGSIYYYREQAGRFELGETTGLDEETILRRLGPSGDLWSNRSGRGHRSASTAPSAGHPQAGQQSAARCRVGSRPARRPHCPLT